VSNLEIMHQSFNNSGALFYIPDSDYKLSFSNLHLKNNTFRDSQLVRSDGNLMLDMNNGLIENNTVSTSSEMLDAS